MRFIETIDSLPDALMVLDNGGFVVWASSGTSEVLGWRPNELIGQSIAVVALEENVAQQRQLLEEVGRTGRAVTFSTQRRRRSRRGLGVNGAGEGFCDRSVPRHLCLCPQREP